MAFVENILTPILQLSMYIFMLIGGCWVIYKGVKTKWPDFYWILKYKLLRRDVKEEDVAWCMDAIEKKMKHIDIKKTLLIKGDSVKRSDEMVYLFNQVKTKMKGGDDDGEFRQSNEEVEEIKG